LTALLQVVGRAAIMPISAEGFSTSSQRRTWAARTASAATGAPRRKLVQRDLLVRPTRLGEAEVGEVGKRLEDSADDRFSEIEISIEKRSCIPF
jgi:hypothetical protein